MITQRVRDALNAQIDDELQAAYQYLAMASCAENKGLTGTANWFFLQAQEELMHGRRLYDYVHSQGEQVFLAGIAKPQADFDSPLSMFEAALAFEVKVSAKIGEVLQLAREENDNATQIFLQWFVTEQVEEEEQARNIIDMLKLAGEKGEGLFLVDKELGQRQLTAG